MELEAEAKFLGVDRPKLQTVLRATAELTHERRLMRRAMFALPGVDDKTAWARVRDEGDRVTAAYKVIKAGQQYEVELVVDDFEKAKVLFSNIGLREVKYQESYREDWHLGESTVSIDEWPKIGLIVEIEAPDLDVVKKVSQSLGLNCSNAYYHGRNLPAEVWKSLRQDRLTFERS